MVETTPVHVCECSLCCSGVEHPEKAQHAQLNLLISRFDEQQRRWFVALELSEPPQAKRFAKNSFEAATSCYAIRFSS